jgi:16S rRNA processing protein RimM
MEQAPEWILVGEVRRPHGTVGELLVKSYSERGDRFKPGAKLFLADGKGHGRRQMEVVASRETAKGLLIMLAGIDTRELAAELNGSLLFISGLDLEPPEAGSYYDFQLEGIAVYSGSKQVGVVSALLETAANPVLELKPEGGGSKLYIPFVTDVILSIDLHDRRIVIPEGFLE